MLAPGIGRQASRDYSEQKLGIGRVADLNLSLVLAARSLPVPCISSETMAGLSVDMKS